MAWLKEAISDGELDALARAARMAWADDTRLSRYAGQRSMDVGQCYVSSLWLLRRLGGHVGLKHGHYVWLSPDSTYHIDLTGNHHGSAIYAPTPEGYETFSPIDSERTRRYVRRAERLFDNLGSLLHLGTDYVGDAYPAEEPQATEDRDSMGESHGYWHDEPGVAPETHVYRFFYGNGELEVSPNHAHDELAGHLGIDTRTHTGPVAAGHIAVNNGVATFEVATNVNIKALERVFKDYAKQVGWEWGGLTDAEGQPISDEFAPKRSRVLSWLYDEAQDHLSIGSVSSAELRLVSLSAQGPEAVLAGVARVSEGSRGGRASVSPVHAAALPALLEWAEDSGLVLYAGNDNTYKTTPDLELFDRGSDGEDSSFQPRIDEVGAAGLHQCPSCDRLFGSWHDYQKHRREEESWGDPVEDGKFPPAPDMDDALPAHYTEQQPTGFTTGAIMQTLVSEARRVHGFERYAKAFNYDNDDYTHYVAYLHGSPVGYASISADNHLQMVHTAVQRKGIARALIYKVMSHYPELSTNTMHDWEAAPLRKAGWVNTNGQMWKWARGQSPSQTLEAPVPFIYDVQEDTVSVGHPGARTSDIPGRFTPGGIVEGTYEPGGKVFVRSMTTIPYTVRHLIQLWYYQYPELEVKSVHLRDDEGKDTKLAKAEVGPMVKTLMASSPAALAAARILTDHGGEVYVVGGAVRDTLLGTTPNDFDLMVRGLPADHVSKMLRALPGRVDYTGRDFGVFRYKVAGDEVEVALPRTERSTGEGHGDFDVKVDHTMKVEDDLYRRDFTANAMAVNLKTGALIDPFGGAADIASHTLRVLNDDSLAEDPLRVIRALVAYSRYGLVPEDSTRRQMLENAHRLSHLPAERIQAELDKLMASKNPSAGIKLAHDTGVLDHIFPEVEAAFDYDQKNPHHAHDLGTHLLEVLNNMVGLTDDVDLRYAALLHDIGKPASAWWHPVDGRQKYYEHVPNEDIAGQAEDGSPMTLDAGVPVGQNHHSVGSELAIKRLRALKFPNDRINRISSIIEHHMFAPFNTTRGARRFLNRVGDHADDLITFRIADQGGKGDAVMVGDGRKPEGIQQQADLINQVRSGGEPHSYAQLAVDGRDLIAAGIPEGPEIGRIKQLLLNTIIENPEYNTPEYLLAVARQAMPQPAQAPAPPQPPAILSHND